MKLFIYEHCPFCIRVRLAAGAKHLDLPVQYLDNDNEADPIRMVGAKQVPILEYEVDGVTKYMPESLDIVKYLDAHCGEQKDYFAPAENEDLKKWLEDSSDIRTRLALPRWIETSFPEFTTQEAKNYFKNKKEAMKGPFAELIANTPEYLEKLRPHLEKLAKEIIRSEDGRDGVNGKGRVDYDDIALWPFLINLTIVKGFPEVAPEKVKNYIQFLSEKCNLQPFYQYAV